MNSPRLQLVSAALAILLAGDACGQTPASEARIRTDEPAIEELRREIEAESPDLSQRLSRPLTLEDCIQLALERNLELTVARQSRDAAQLRIGITHGEYLPELQAEANGLRRQDPTGFERRKDAAVSIVQRLPIGTSLAAGMVFNDTNGDGVRTEAIPSVVLTQPLLRNAGWGRGMSRIRDAHLTADISQISLREAILSIEFQVQSAYLEILRRKNLIEVNERAVARDQELLDFSRAKLSAQLATQRDVLSAEIVLAQDRGTLVNAQAQYQAAMDDMSNILGVRIARPLEIQDEDLAVDPQPIDEEACIAKALEDNPSVQRSRLDLDRSQLARDVAGNERLPQLDLRAGYSQSRTPLAANPATRAWEGGVVMSYPFLNKVRGGAYEQAGIAYEQQRRVTLQTERLVTLSVRDAVRNLQRSQDRLSILKKSTEGAQAKVEYAKVNFQLGRASNLDITDAQKDLLDSETDTVNELVIYRLGLARLEQLLGGSL